LEGPIQAASLDQNSEITCSRALRRLTARVPATMLPVPQAPTGIPTHSAGLPPLPMAKNLSPIHLE